MLEKAFENNIDNRRLKNNLKEIKYKTEWKRRLNTW